jgi:hypothetical protein
MSRALTLTPLALLLAAVPALAATTYEINFTVTDPLGAPSPTSGSFTWDGSTFSNFTVKWQGITFDLTASANAPALLGATGCNGEASTPSYGFILITQTATGCKPIPGAAYIWSAADLSASQGKQSTFVFGYGNGTPPEDEILDYEVGNIPPGDSVVVANGKWTLTAEAPEPGSLGLVLLGTLAVGLRRYWREHRG